MHVYVLVLDRHSMTVEAPRKSNPHSKGHLLFGDLSAYHPIKGLPRHNAAPYTASKIEIHFWVSFTGVPARSVREKGRTGTMIPYKKMSVKTARQIVETMKSFELRISRKIGGGVVASIRSPELRKLKIRFIVGLVSS